MAVTRQFVKGTARMKLNNGISPTTGQVLTVNQSMPALSANYNSSTDDSKLMNVINALVSCLTKSVYSVEFVTTQLLVE